MQEAPTQLLCVSEVLTNLNDRWSKALCWDLNLQPFLLKGPTVFQPPGQPLCLPAMRRSVIPPSALSPLFQLPVFSFSFHSFGSIPSIYLLGPRSPHLFLSAPPLWYFPIGVVFPSLPPFTLSWIHHWFRLTLNRSLIHYFHLFTPCPALAVFFEIR